MSMHGTENHSRSNKLDLYTNRNVKKAANTYSWGTHRPWAARGTGGRTIPGDIRRRCAGAWARTDIRPARI